MSIDGVNSRWADGQFLASTAVPINVKALYAAQVTSDVLNVRSAPSLSGCQSGSRHQIGQN